MKKRFPLFVKIALISVYVIFLAGSVVRMTGSGMGCPDWPKCFGYYIPPTSEDQITWKPDAAYNKGMIIIKDKALFVAQKRLTSGANFNLNNWEKYTKHNYASFNKYHTWTEYINRLTSVLAGFAFVFLLISAWAYRKENKEIVALSFLAFFLMLVQAWLGKTVVDSNLKPTIITIHMVGGLVIIGILLRLMYISATTLSSKPKKAHPYHSLFNKLLIISVVFSLIQIALGTQVRQFIDEQVKLFGFENKNYSLLNPNFKFYFHRSFTIAIIAVNLGLFYINQVKNLGYSLVNWILGLLFLETLTGILMYYASFPLGTQATHLLAGAVLFGLQCYLWLQSRKAKEIGA
ncbi:cytochrome oxidase assembly protein [Polaribacter pacificus]|uniref:Cytochrome oxidase assembly protein n=1 Tax=Polaribacter pacificus TaxID=1775173 RepID=A0A917HXJ5_9FLAO|nr:COX15/CtaA family protein [Polaribacter pacificus]GGG94201.1 cytochrome oxidase assembly protein [Polaribacter pacificus]